VRHRSSASADLSLRARIAIYFASALAYLSIENDRLADFPCSVVQYAGWFSTIRPDASVYTS
jgi:hypothetical protein